MKTPAAILVEQRQPLLIDEVELPALGYGQVLVQIRASRICGSQLGEIDGVKGPDRYLPHLLGHEAGGVVVDIGPEVSHVRAGDHVVLHWRPGAGIQAAPSKYRLGSKTINAGHITTFQGLTVVSENRLTRIPTDTDFEVAALLADTLTTGFGVVTRDARIMIGEAAVVIGVGGIGLGTVLGAHLAGAYPVIGVDLHDHKLTKAREFGASHTINTRHENLADGIQRIVGAPADVVFDVTGNAAVIKQAWDITSPKGRLILVGVMRHDQQLSFNTLPLHHGKVLTGSEGGSSQPHRDIPNYLRMIRAGRFDPRGMISHRGSLAQVNDLIASLRRGEVTQAMLTFPA